MKARKPTTWCRRLLQLLVVLLIVGLAAHPELAHLGALLDTLGLDTVLLLLEAQVLAVLGLATQSFLRPVGRWLWLVTRPIVHMASLRARSGTPAALVRASDRFWIGAAGPLGQYLYLQLRCRLRSAFAAG